MNRLSLGTAQFGMSYGIANTTGRVPRDELSSILDLCNESKIDTTISYGDC